MTADPKATHAPYCPVPRAAQRGESAACLCSDSLAAAPLLPYSAANGAIVCCRLDRDTYEVGFRDGRRCNVDTDCTEEDGEWAVDFPPHTHIADDERHSLTIQAREALDEWMFRTR